MTDSDSVAQTEQLPAPISDEPEARPPVRAPPTGAPAPTEHSRPHSEGHAPSGAPHSERRHEGSPREGAPREIRPPRALREENTIFIGRKSTMGYVLAVVTQFQNGAPQVKIKARGKIISMAVDVAEIVRRRFLPDVKVSHIGIQTEDVENEDHSRSKVSSIEIVLAK